MREEEGRKRHLSWGEERDDEREERDMRGKHARRGRKREATFLGARSIKAAVLLEAKAIGTAVCVAFTRQRVLRYRHTGAKTHTLK